MDESAENSHNNANSDIETLDYLRGVKSSTCLLLPTTPSPTPLEFKHPLSEEMSEHEEPFLAINDESNGNLQNSGSGSTSYPRGFDEESGVYTELVPSDPPSQTKTNRTGGDSSSSADSNSVVQDPVSAQLINNISMLDYQTLSKNGDLIMGPAEDCKLNGNLNVSNRKLPNFVNWNWRIIRKVLLWVVLSGLVACLASIVAMVVTMPRACNPDIPWYQGKVFYEIFPASFKDSNGDGIGDFKGIMKKLDYIEEMGASAIRLNSIFEAYNYPEQYYNVTSLIKIARSLGTIDDFKELVSEVHKRNMSLVLDMPVSSMIKSQTQLNSSEAFLYANDTIIGSSDMTTAAIVYWTKALNVDGFYLKNLEYFVEDINFGKSLQLWKQIVGSNKILMASEKTLNSVSGDALNILLSRIDLIDIHIDLQDYVVGLKNKITEIVTGNLWSKPHYPWVHWNIGNIYSERISTKHINNTLALTALELMLPGTVSIFYGDEIGLGGLPAEEVETDFHEHQYIHNLVPMSFSGADKKESLGILPWNSKSVLEPSYNFLKVIKSFTEIRLSTPTIYLRAIYKDGNIQKNIDIKKIGESLILIERWYPRRNACVFVGNLGSKPVTTDLSAMYYGGTVVAATNSTLVGQVLYFDQVTFLPNSAILFKLEK